MISDPRWIKLDEIRLYFTIHPLGKNPPLQIGFWLNSVFFFFQKHRFHILHFPNSTGRHYTKYRFTPDIAFKWHLPHLWSVGSHLFMFTLGHKKFDLTWELESSDTIIRITTVTCKFRALGFMVAAFKTASPTFFYQHRTLIHTGLVMSEDDDDDALWCHGISGNCCIIYVECRAVGSGTHSR
jgi:hypothetical protein